VDLRVPRGRGLGDGLMSDGVMLLLLVVAFIFKFGPVICTLLRCNILVFCCYVPVSLTAVCCLNA